MQGLSRADLRELREATRWRAPACAPIDKVDQAWIRKLFDVGGEVKHERSGFQYKPVRRGNATSSTRPCSAATAARLATWEEPVTHVFSAGSYGLALFSRRGTALVHLPIDYYAQAGRWDLDPMAFGGNPRMNVALDTYCISCHSDDVAKRFDDPLPGGVGCERCHGPSKKHIDTLKKEDTVDPKRLAARRQLEVCAECHQSTFPVLRPARDHFGFRPGEVLDEFRVSFLAEPAEPDRVKLLAHAERLVLSACWRGAPDKLTCTTCHDPHVSSIDEPASWWDKPCLQCHDPKSCTDTAEHRAAAGDHCARCHMRRGQTANVPLVAITDHWIQKKPPPINPQLVEKPHAIVPWSAQIGEPVKDGMTGLAAVANADAGLTDEAERLAIEAVHDRPTPQVWNVLANAFLARHREPDAGRAYQQALGLDPDDTTALLGYARAMLDANRVADARKAFDRLLAIDPEDVAALETLGIHLHRHGDGARSESSCSKSAVATGRASGISYVGLALDASGRCQKELAVARARMARGAARSLDRRRARARRRRVGDTKRIRPVGSTPGGDRAHFQRIASSWTPATARQQLRPRHRGGAHVICSSSYTKSRIVPIGKIANQTLYLREDRYRADGSIFSPVRMMGSPQEAARNQRE